jgi:hypothetical protein
MMFDSTWLRFAISGTLITGYMVCDWRARRRGVALASRPGARWTRVAGFVSLAAFYLLIRPTGGPLIGGLGNLAGIALALGAFAMRMRAHGRFAEPVARGVFYLALPIAVGVPWGLLVLTLPACGISVWRYIEARRIVPAARESAGA